LNLRDSFGARHGIGILATADAEVRADAAVCPRPNDFDDGSATFVMRDRNHLAAEAITIVGRARVQIEEAVHVGSFQRVTTWRAGA